MPSLKKFYSISEVSLILKKWLAYVILDWLEWRCEGCFETSVFTVCSFLAPCSTQVFIHSSNHPFIHSSNKYFWTSTVLSAGDPNSKQNVQNPCLHEAYLLLEGTNEIVCKMGLVNPMEKSNAQRECGSIGGGWGVWDFILSRVAGDFTGQITSEQRPEEGKGVITADFQEKASEQREQQQWGPWGRRMPGTFEEQLGWNGKGKGEDQQGNRGWGAL